ncbi:FMN-binding split barrel-related protein [Penicillium concentricum]|uniref:pyridoxal 5'-phosphate synthase n=1 Tax=Penicillium concentricum TaxID=293559 RepID=A0A9W9R954_9EURO|nr:FMN-binding split barrel-related protein [Penicillium concentricum]KAJ5355881.1 FMN-binding split barrel-related protein [Penicillium concentricum]
MQTRLPFTFRSAVDSFLRTSQPRQLRYSTNPSNRPTMDQNEHQTDAHRRPKKLIFAPGDIAPTSEEPTPEPQQAVPAPSQIAEALRTSTPTPASTPNSTTETEVLSHAARAHQFGTNPPLTISQIHGTNPLHQFNTWFRDPRLPASSAPETCTLSTASLPSGRVSARIVYLKELDERGWVVYSNWGSREGKGGQVFGLGDSADTLGAMPEPTSITSEVGTGNKWGALTFSWAGVERQVRIEGLLEPLSREESEMYWRTRERGSQIGGWASWQSRVLWSAEPGKMEENQRRKSVAKLQGAFDGNSIVPADIDQTDDEDGRALLELKVKEMEERFKGVEDIPLPPFWGGVRLVPESVEFWQGRRSRLHDRFRYVRVEGEEEGAKWRLQRLSPIYNYISTAAMSTSTQSTSSTSPWIILAITSGAFAALNGVFAKLTTDDHTTAFAQSLAHLFGLESSPIIEMLTRGACLGLNVICNIIMWALFTRALTAGPSTVKVSITNTASNFLATALFGMVVFQEAVGGLWWLGAAMMGAGCILVGMREGA